MMDNRAHVINLAKQGIPPREITKLVPLQIGTIYEYIRIARSEGHDIPLFKLKSGAPEGPRVTLCSAVVERLEPHAESRGITLKALIYALLETISRDDLVDAVLDDTSAQNRRTQ